MGRGPTHLGYIPWEAAGAAEPAQAAATRGIFGRGWRFPRDPLFLTSLELCVWQLAYMPSQVHLRAQ